MATAFLTRMNAFLARGCHSAITMMSRGIAASETRPSCRLISSRAKRIQKSPMRSPRVMTATSRSCWSW